MEVFKEGKLSVEWIKEADKKDNLMSKIRAYYLPGTKIKPEFRCSAVRCVMPVRNSEYLNPSTAEYEYNPMMLCFTCNQLYHVCCVGLNHESISEEAVPWLCMVCRENVLNSHAAAYYKSTGYKLCIAERRRKFLRESTIPAQEKEFDTDEEYDSCDLAAFSRHKENTSKFKDVGNNEDADKASHWKQVLEKERNETRMRMDVMMDEIKRLREELNEAKSVSFQPSMSAFYSSNAPSPDKESTRWSKRLDENRGHSSAHEVSTDAHCSSSSFQHATSNNSQADTSTLEVLNRFTSCQEKIHVETQLSTIRRAMPKIIEFDGDAMKWLEFEQDVERYRDICKYDDPTIKLHVRGALKGEAFNTVKDVFDIFSLKEIMELLREAFGDPMTMVRRKGKDIRVLKVPDVLYREDAVKIRVVLQGYFAACTYAKTGYLNSNELAEIIYEQFGYEDKARCKEMYVRKNPGKQIIISLNTIYDYLAERLPILDEKPEGHQDRNKKGKPVQVMAVGVSNVSSNKNSYKFEVRDRTTAPYMGYDMLKLNSIIKKCEFCGKAGHYSVQCTQYQGFSEDQRLKAVNEKKLCRNCIVSTGHRASECTLKISCGLKVGKQGRCTQKHHASIHYACDRSKSNGNGKRRPNTRHNTSHAQQALNSAIQSGAATHSSDAVTPQQQAAAAIQSANAQVRSVNAHLSANNTSVNNSRHYNVNPMFTGSVQICQVAYTAAGTVKMFRNNFIGPNGFVVAHSVGDSASEVTLVRDDLRRALGIEGKRETLVVQWTDKTVKEYAAIKFDMEVKGILRHSERIILRDCYAIDELELPARSLDMELLKSLYPYLKDVDFQSYFEEQPVMLIGSPHAFIIEGINGLIEGGEGKPVALETRLGVTVYGGKANYSSSDKFNVNLIAKACGDKYSTVEELPSCERITNEELSGLLTYFNSVESLGIRACASRNTEMEQKAVEIMREELKVLPDGSIEVPLVWNRTDKEIPVLPNNYPLAYQRYLAHERKLNKNPVHLAAFNKNVKELMELGYMRHANEDDLNGQWQNIWYLPMSLVVNENKVPPKYRNVYDASAKYEGVSLNDNLLKGPDLLIDILKPLLRMRMNKIAFTADIQHMFHRMKVCPRDQQCQRIIFRESPDQPIQTLILDSMAFGPSCSPFVSQYVKNWNADNWYETYPEASTAIKELMYMDDLIGSEPTVEKAVKVASQCIKICSHINWNLISFQSNSLEFLKQLPGSNVKKELVPILASEAEEFTTKVLGCHWNAVEDCFVFELNKNIFVKLVNEFKYHPTKRDQSSTVARIYDVLGLIVPFLIRGKILLQRSWKLKIGWDDPIPEEIQHDWCKWLEDIEHVAKLKIVRRYSSLDSLKEADKLQLHIFCDAGVEAFGCVAYWVVHHHGMVESSIVMAKAKVTPLRHQTKSEIKAIPRLELYAALLAVRLSEKITKNFMDLKFDKYYWSDSEVVLRWILNPEAKLLNYAVAPIEEILEASKRSEWRYVPTSENPADLCTKFKKFDFSDSSSEWFVGPKFLRSPFEDWPQMPEKLTEDEIVLACNIFLQKLNYSTHQLPPVNATFLADSFIDNLSSSITGKWSKLVRAVARPLKLFLDVFIPFIRNKQFNNYQLRLKVKEIYDNFDYLTPSDLERAEHFIFRKMQRESFPEEYKQLLEGCVIKNKEFMQLSVFMDPQGIMRINSRANLNSLNYPQQFVPVVPRKNRLTPILLMHYHEKFKHIAAESQIAEVRTRCWIPKLRQALKTVKSHCNECKLRNAQPYDPIMGPLPEFRINPELQPFEVTGVDLFGPIVTVNFGRPKKVWVMIFTCTLTRFIHLHVLDSLETIKVLEAIVIFYNAHGPVRSFLSDNGTNFQGAAKILKSDCLATKKFLSEQAEDLKQELAERYSVEWNFIPPSSPWFGGCYERLIREVKRSLADTLYRRKISKVELSIAVNEAAHRINLRPLTKNAIEAEDEPVLTPHQMAKHRPGWPLLPGIHTGKYGEVDDKSVYRKGRIAADEIMRKFTSNYLPVLTKKVKWLRDKEPLKVDDLVLIIEPNMTRREWPRGRIIKLFYGKDGQPRVADVLKASGKVKRRPIRKLAKIDIQLPVTSM